MNIQHTNVNLEVLDDQIIKRILDRSLNEKYRIKTEEFFDGEHNLLKSKYHVVRPIFFGWIELSTYFFYLSPEIAYLSKHKAVFDTIEIANNYINNYTNGLVCRHQGYKIIKHLHKDMMTEGFALLNDNGIPLPYETLHEAKDTVNRWHTYSKFK